MRKLIAYVPAVILLLGCAFLWQPHAQRSVALAAPLTTVLTDMPGYVFRDDRVTEEERRVAGMTDYVARTYSRDTIVAFSTLVSYYDHQEQGKTIHSPRNCLPGAGWEILRGGTDTGFPTVIPARRSTSFAPWGAEPRDCQAQAHEVT